MYSSTVSDARHRPGRSGLEVLPDGTLLLPIFSLPKGLDPFITLYLHGISSGSATTKETAAEGLNEVIKATAPTALKPYLIKTTGPIIRILGERCPSDVRTALLRTACSLLDRGDVGLKAFAPQLQATFVKSLSDASKQVSLLLFSFDDYDAICFKIHE